MGAVAGPASAAAPILGLVSGVMQGEGTQAADEYQASQLSEKAQLGQAAAVETNADMVARLNQSLGNIDAVRAASGDSPASPTGAALRDVTTGRLNQEKAIRVGNILTQSETDTAGANYLTQAGSFALMQGILGGAASGAAALAKTNPGTFGA
jgi:hypothetical protein